MKKQMFFVAAVIAVAAVFWYALGGSANDAVRKSTAEWVASGISQYRSSHLSFPLSKTLKRGVTTYPECESGETANQLVSCLRNAGTLPSEREKENLVDGFVSDGAILYCRKPSSDAVAVLSEVGRKRGDAFEVPTGSGRWYLVSAPGDIPGTSAQITKFDPNSEGINCR